MSNIIIETKKLADLRAQICANISHEQKVTLMEYRERFGLEFTVSMEENWRLFWDWCVNQVRSEHSNYTFRLAQKSGSPYESGDIIKEYIYHNYYQEEKFLREQWNPMGLVLFLKDFNLCNLTNITPSDIVYCESIDKYLDSYNIQHCDKEILKKTRAIEKAINELFLNTSIQDAEHIRIAMQMYLYRYDFTLMHNYLASNLYNR